MLKIIVGSAIGGLVAGGIALIAASQARGSAEQAGPAPSYGAVVPDRVPQSYLAYPQPASDAPLVRAALAPMPAEAVPVAAATPAARARPARQVVYRDAGEDMVRYEPDVRREKRSIAKTAMLIGGSAGTGAGVGAIFGGKKGALIGAAIGGGAASIYEASKR